MTSPRYSSSRWSIGGFLRSVSGGKAPLGAHDDPDNAVIIFDWDDTLCPTWWASAASGLEDNAVRLDVDLHRAELHQHTATVMTILRAAKEVARVGVVTLATREWVTSSSRRLFPDL